MTTPLPITSIGFCLIHGRTGLGSRIWLNTLTTESAEPPACAWAPRSVKTTAEAAASHRAMLFMILASSRRTDIETHAFPVSIRTPDQDLTIAPRNHAGRVSGPDRSVLGWRRARLILASCTNARRRRRRTSKPGVAERTLGTRGFPVAWSSGEPRRGSTIRLHGFARGDTRHAACATPSGLNGCSGLETQGAPPATLG